VDCTKITAYRASPFDLAEKSRHSAGYKPKSTIVSSPAGVFATMIPPLERYVGHIPHESKDHCGIVSRYSSSPPPTNEFSRIKAMAALDSAFAVNPKDHNNTALGNSDDNLPAATARMTAENAVPHNHKVRRPTEQ
jgi:hypothetical protein